MPSSGNARPFGRLLRWFASAQVIYGNKNSSPGGMYGTTPAYLDVHHWPVAEGDMFSDTDVRNRSKVCVIGQTVVKDLFEGASPVGKEIRLNNVMFRVVGVLAVKGANMFGGDQDDILLAPWTTIKSKVSGTSSSTVVSTSITSTVNTLDQLYPGGNDALYPAQDATTIADNPQPVKFTTIDQILVAADGSSNVPLAMRQMTDLLRERHRPAPRSAR